MTKNEVEEDSWESQALFSLLVVGAAEMAGFVGRCLCGAVLWACAAPALWMGHCRCES
ncbi:MAG: hypothetical protein AAF763_01545 [Pseudomonadota bacterium]